MPEAGCLFAILPHVSVKNHLRRLFSSILKTFHNSKSVANREPNRNSPKKVNFQTEFLKFVNAYKRTFQEVPYKRSKQDVTKECRCFERREINMNSNFISGSQLIPQFDPYRVKFALLHIRYFSCIVIFLVE